MAKQGYVALCYHYIRPEGGNDPFARILGNSVNEFKRHIEMAKKNYHIISPDKAEKFSYKSGGLGSSKPGLLFTFDDGLSDHYKAAKILYERGIKAFFFLPTCILKDRLPANPTIIHYCLARYGIDRFLKAYRDAIKEHGLDIDKYNTDFHKGKDDPWQAISHIKSIINYDLRCGESRSILLHIYTNLLLRNHPDAMDIMHLNYSNIKDMMEMGHSIGAHSYSHISFAAPRLSDEDLVKEIIEPQKYLSETFDTKVTALSYPFGSKKDCLGTLGTKDLIYKTKDYRLAFTIEKILNTKSTSPYELGRYMPTSSEDDVALKRNLELIVNN